MANLKDLIVRGVTRILGKLYTQDVEISGSVTGNAIESTPTSGSNKLVTSGGVYTACTPTSTYSATGTQAVNGKAVKAALDTLSATSPTAATTTSTTFIDTVSQSGGKISATKKTLPTASSSTAGITKVGASGGAAAYSHTHTSLDSSVSAGDHYTPVYVDDGVPTVLAYNMPQQVVNVDSTSTRTVITATVPGVTELVDGLTVRLNNIVASGSNTDCTLNVNSLGALPIYLSYPVTTRVTTHWAVNSVFDFIYSSTLVEGGCWIMQIGRDTNTTYSNATLGQGYGECSTAEATLAKASTISSYALTAGGIVSIKFTYAVPANSTLNIRTRGAKAIYYHGAPITDGVIEAGDTVTFIYSTYYHVIAIDRDSSEDFTILSGGSAAS